MSDFTESNVTDEERERFDELLERVLGRLPDSIHHLLEEVPLIVDDAPWPALMEEMELEHPDELCGLHDGIPLTERTVSESAHLPETIHIFREGILASSCDEQGRVDPAELLRQIRITVLHEIGHHFGLDEKQLEELGYG